ELHDGEAVSPDYDTPAYRAELDSWFAALGLVWHWLPITLTNLGEQLEVVQTQGRSGKDLVLNLCDGDEIHGYPGRSVVLALEQAGLPFTGAASTFYEATTYKAAMKERLMAAGVATPPFVRLTGTDADLECLAEAVGFPALVKPEVSAASVGIGLRSLVFDAESAAAQFARLTQGAGGERFLASGVIAERFVDGPEYTALVVAGRVYPVVERVFHSALPPHERFLSYDRYWSAYQEESRLPEGEPFYRYALASPSRQEELAPLAQRAFAALSGTGYARVDIRVQSRTNQPYVLEVNANCGLSGDTETSVGQILRLTGSSMPGLLSEILEDGLARAGVSR
ncbi:MAG: hypothetical protein WDA75_21960, partial [Candidatus Latescibacterota bacterium]